MSNIFGNKYRITSTRLRKWDYSQNGYYYVTICTKDRINYFGEGIGNKVRLSHIGEIATSYWKNIPIHFPFVKLDEYIVMPNHVHGILIIDNQRHTVETQNFASLQNTFKPQSKNLASIIRGFKIGVTKYYRQITSIQTIWQPRFYDHVIRNEDEYMRIRQYIQANPYNWESDEGKSDDW